MVSAVEGSLREAFDVVKALAGRAGLLARRARSRISPPPVALVHHPRYRIPQNPLADVKRQEKILAYALSRGFSKRIVVRGPPPSSGDLVRVHTPDYLASLDTPEGLRRILAGLEGDAASLAFLVAQRWATAGTVAAARLALQKPERLAQVVNLGGGFHHAHRDRGGGFCALNDVAVAIARLRHDGFRGRVLVVDVDQHHGDGTKTIFAADADVFTYSIHAEDWNRDPAVSNLDVPLGPAIGDGTYLVELKKSLAPFAERARPDIVFFVAGVDVAQGDALGGFLLSDEGIARRDAFVLEITRGIPTVIVLAGGYGPDAWRHTARLVSRLLTREDVPIASGTDRALARFRDIRAELTARELTQDGTEDTTFAIRESDLMGDLVEKAPEPKLLGFYSEYGLEIAFERYGLAEHLRRRGYPRFHIELEPKSGLGQGFRVFGKPGKRDLLIEVVVSSVVVEDPLPEPLRLVQIEWMLLQDPNRSPTADRPLLPGQKFPGLGVSPIVIGMLLMAAERLGYDGLSLVPAHYHVYQVSRALFRYLVPEDEAEVTALTRVVHDATSPMAKNALHGIVDGTTGEPFVWQGKRMVCPISPRLKAWLESAEYAERVEKEAARRAFTRAG